MHALERVQREQRLVLLGGCDHLLIQRDRSIVIAFDLCQRCQATSCNHVFSLSLETAPTTCVSHVNLSHHHRAGGNSSLEEGGSWRYLFALDLGANDQLLQQRIHAHGVLLQPESEAASDLRMAAGLAQLEQRPQEALHLGV